MIFGFNTDVKHDETVYHVQSEARQNELLLLTEIFVKGRCVGKRAASYAEHTIQPDFSDEHIHEMLKEQHKYFVAAVREGRIDAEFPEAAASQPALASIEDAAAEASTPELESAPLEDLAAFAAAFNETPTPKQAEFTLSAIGGVIGKGLTLDCLPPLCAAGGNTVIVCVQISDDSGPVSGAQVTCRITSSRGPASYVYSASGDTGIAEVDVELPELDLATAALLIQASEGGRSVSRKFQLRQA